MWSLIYWSPRGTCRVVVDKMAHVRNVSLWLAADQLLTSVVQPLAQHYLVCTTLQTDDWLTAEHCSTARHTPISLSPVSWISVSLSRLDCAKSAAGAGSLESIFVLSRIKIVFIPITRFILLVTSTTYRMLFKMITVNKEFHRILDYLCS